jgi:hypothetical protein
VIKLATLPAISLLGLGSVAAAQSAPGSGMIQRYDGEGISKWAACGWVKAPVTSDNMLKAEAGTLVTAKPSRNPMAGPKQVLALRMDAACGELLSPRDRSTISYGVQLAKLKALKAVRPAQPALKEAKNKALVCELSMDGRVVITVLSSENKKPKAPAGAQTKCYKTLEDGSLV